MNLCDASMPRPVCYQSDLHQKHSDDPNVTIHIGRLQWKAKFLTVVNGDGDWAVYKRLRNKINGEVKSSNPSYYANAFIQCNGDSTKAWQMINELTFRLKNNASVKELKLHENSVTNSH